MATFPQPPEGESLRIVFEQETDGRWLAEVPELPGVMLYGKTKNDAEVAVTALALRVIGVLDRRNGGQGSGRLATD